MAGAESGPGRAEAPAGTVAGGLEKRLVALMAARLALSLLSLGIAFALDAAGGELAIVHRKGLYGTVALAFLATGVNGLALRRARRTERFAAVHIAIDISFVSALVLFSGGEGSVFTFLYVLVAVYGAMLFQRGGALVAAGVGALAYGAVLVALHPPWEPASWSGPVDGPSMLLTLWAVQAGAILLVAALSSFLSAELRQTGAALDARTTDLERLRTLHARTVESLMSGLLTVDRDGRITSFNPEAERITGLAAAEAMGRDVEAVLPGVRRRVIGRAEARGGPQVRERMGFRDASGDDLHLGMAAYILREADGTPGGHVVIFQDVTRVVEMEQELRRSERLAAVGGLSASIAHEIRNPLAAIYGSIQMIESRIRARGADREIRRLMDIVLRETDRLNHLITDFLIFARPGPLHREAVVLADSVGEILKMFDAMRPAGVEVSVDVASGLAVHADADRLRQVLWNLIRNAAEAMPQGGRLAIGAVPLRDGPAQEAPGGRRNEEQEKSGQVEICISDEGVGIPPEVRERVFDPFFTTKRGGSGLGLATVHRIVEDHGGSIRLESSVGQGTTVRLRLPRTEGTR